MYQPRISIPLKAHFETYCPVPTREIDAMRKKTPLALQDLPLLISRSRKLAPIRLWPRVGERDVLHGLTLSAGAVVRLRCASDSPNGFSFLAGSAIRRPLYLIL